MRKTNIPNNLNHKPQAHARVCKENVEKNNSQLKYFAVKRSTLEACRQSWESYFMKVIYYILLASYFYEEVI